MAFLGNPPPGTIINCKYLFLCFILHACHARQSNAILSRSSSGNAGQLPPEKLMLDGQKSGLGFMQSKLQSFQDAGMHRLVSYLTRFKVASLFRFENTVYSAIWRSHFAPRKKKLPETFEPSKNPWMPSWSPSPFENTLRLIENCATDPESPETEPLCEVLP